MTSLHLAAHHKIFKKDSHWIFHSFGTPYDYNSIMHYGTYHFSKNGRRTIVSRKPNVKWFGNRYPSKVDIIQVCKSRGSLFRMFGLPVFTPGFNSARLDISINFLLQRY